ncbi:MAG: right-handed parallel beta-helix repeat-containing protein [Planctomycetota bacterium]
MPKLILIALATLVLGGLAGAQVTIYVDAAATPGGNGTVASPFALIQDGINAAIDGDTVQVAAGTYFESIDYAGRAISVVGAGPDASTIDGSSGSISTVRMIGPFATSASLQGFTVTGGTNGWLDPALSSSIFIPSGGGIFIQNPTGMATAAVVADCHITGNSAPVGGGIFAAGSGLAASFLNCVIDSNTSSFFGGGAAVGATHVIFEGCEVRNNSSIRGAGIDAGAFGHLEIRSSVIESNVAHHPTAGAQALGAGINAEVAIVTLKRTQIINNHATSDYSLYGGVRLTTSSLSTAPDNLHIENCLIAGNSSGGYSVFLSGGGDLSNTTIADNTITGVVYPTVSVLVAALNSSMLSCRNLIVFGNSATELLVSPNTVQNVSIASSNIPGGYTGPGNVDLDPLFVDSTSGDFRLRFDSPLIDAGDNAAVMPPQIDLDGRPRVLNQFVDMGAYESDDIANHASAAGTLVDPADGSPFRALSANGDDGGPDYRVTVPAFSPWSFSFTSPPWMMPHPDFAIFGALAEATIETVVSVPLGIGDMSFLPCPLAPQFEGPVFTLTSTVPLPCNEVLPSVPGPSWTTPIIPGLPAPLDISFQGVLLDATGAVHRTNLLMINIR